MTSGEADTNWGSVDLYTTSALKLQDATDFIDPTLPILAKGTKKKISKSTQPGKSILTLTELVYIPAVF